MKKTLFIILLLLVFASSCSNDNFDENTVSNKQSSGIEYSKTEFAKGLALAIEDINIKNFIKKEALLQIDNDYDVIYHLVKNKRLESGETFKSALSRYFGGERKLDEITNLDNTLTISVPYVNEKINIETWITEMESPIVAVRESTISKKQTELEAYDRNGHKLSIKRYEEPAEVVLVVKSNERLSDSDNNLYRSKTVNKNLQLTNDNQEVIGYFLDESFVNLDINRTKNIYENAPASYFFDKKIFQSYFYNFDSQRDYIYYGISNTLGINKGQLDSNFREYIYSIKFNNYSSLSHINDLNDASKEADWSDGNFEIVFNFLFLTQESVISTVTKMSSIPKENLFVDANKTIKTYYFTTPIEVFNWDMYRYGNAYKIIVSEYDPGTITETNQSTSSTFSNSWEISANGGFGLIWKVGAKYNGSVTSTKQSSTKITSTNNSDALGECIVDFFNPIFTSETITFRCNIKSSLISRGIDEFASFKNNEFEQYKKWYNEKLVQYSGKRISISLIDGGKEYLSNSGMVSLEIRPEKVSY